MTDGGERAHLRSPGAADRSFPLLWIAGVASVALAASGITDAQRPAYEKALADLARSSMIEVREQ